jgi:hypothetical protein
MLFTLSLSTYLRGFGNTDYVACIFVGEGKKTIPYLPPTPADTWLCLIDNHSNLKICPHVFWKLAVKTQKTSDAC